MIRSSSGISFLVISFLLFLIFFFLPSISFFFLPVPVPSCRQHSAGCRAIMLWRGFCTDSHRSYNIHFIQNCWMSSLSFISLFLFVYCLSSDYFGVGSDFERRQSLGGFIRSANIHHVDVVSFALFSLLFLLLSFFSWRRRNSRIWHCVCKREIGGRKTSVGSRVWGWVFQGRRNGRCVCVAFDWNGRNENEDVWGTCMDSRSGHRAHIRLGWGHNIVYTDRHHEPFHISYQRERETKIL